MLLAAGDQWFEIELDNKGARPVDVFGGMFTESVEAYLNNIRPSKSRSLELTRLFGMADWPDATEGDLLSALTTNCSIEMMAVYDVGQGSSNALICQCGQLVTYFDTGCGVYRNHKTRPSKITFCTHEPPRVILSHWDADHWAAAKLDSRLLRLTWIVPRQSISGVHVTFANQILKSGGRILVVPPSLTTLQWREGKQTLEIRRCTGIDRNGSGLALIVEDSQSKRGWLMTGDAAYSFVPGPLPTNLVAIVVPHHGADMGRINTPPGPSTNYHRLLYSFGPGNAHGRTSIRHPTPATVSAHLGAGWRHVGWYPPPPAIWRANPPVLATASHPASHEMGLIVGWSEPAVLRLSGHIAGCPDVMPIVQT